MLYRKIPKTGDSLSILGFGCMRLPMQDGKIDAERAIRQIRHAVDQGVNYADTAWPYHAGESETLLGKALKDGYREKVKVATKLPTWIVNRRDDMDRFLETQMKKLDVSHLDYYLVHSLSGPAWDRVKKLGVADFLDKAKADGRIGNAGFSYHGLGVDFKPVVDGYPWEFCQIQYNYLDQQNQAGTAGLQYAASRKLGVIIMEPLRGGNLARAEQPPAIQAIWNEAKTRRTPAEWALLWVWNHPEVTVVLSGMNEEAQVEENLRIAETAPPGNLTAEELALVERVNRKYQELMKVPCTGCGYCLPCPSDVWIPFVFEDYNKMHMFGEIEPAKFHYAVRMSGILADGTKRYASQCVECGECLKKCPQHIQIPELLAKIAEEMEGPDLEKRLALIGNLFKKEA